MATERLMVGDLMNADVYSVEADEFVEVVDKWMKESAARHVPVVERGKVVGIISDRDIIAARLSPAGSDRPLFKAFRANELMTSPPITVQAKTPAPEAADLLLQHKIGCLPVVGAAGELVGIVTETDFLRAAYARPTS